MASAGVLPGRQKIRVCRANAVIGGWPVAEVLERIANGDLLPSDEFYDDEISEWFPLAELRLRSGTIEGPKCFKRPCYCGTGLAFAVCCGGNKS
jgi:hypothetical protein